VKRRKKNAGHSTFHGKVAALQAKGYPLANARRIVGAEVRDAAKLATKAGRKAYAFAAKKAHQLHLAIAGRR
jgi:hypothetical protein